MTNAVLRTLLYSLLVWAQNTLAAEAPQQSAPAAEQNVQAWLGGVSTDDDWSNTDPTDNEPLTGDIGTLPYLGGAGQKLWGGMFQAGFEGGGLVTWKNDSTNFFATNGSLRISVDNTLWSVEVFMGAVVSVRPVSWLRIYGAAGPSVAYANLDDDNDEADTPQPNATTVRINASGGSTSAALYARGGFEFEIRQGFTFGAFARYADHEFDFDEGGKLKLGNVQYFVSFGQRL
jgi:hypothetical protein